MDSAVTALEPHAHGTETVSLPSSVAESPKSAAADVFPPSPAAAGSTAASFAAATPAPAASVTARAAVPQFSSAAGANTMASACSSSSLSDAAALPPLPKYSAAAGASATAQTGSTLADGIGKPSSSENFAATDSRISSTPPEALISSRRGGAMLAAVAPTTSTASGGGGLQVGTLVDVKEPRGRGGGGGGGVPLNNDGRAGAGGEEASNEVVSETGAQLLQQRPHLSPQSQKPSSMSASLSTVQYAQQRISPSSTQQLKRQGHAQQPHEQQQQQTAHMLHHTTSQHQHGAPPPVSCLPPVQQQPPQHRSEQNYWNRQQHAEAQNRQQHLRHGRLTIDTTVEDAYHPCFSWESPLEPQQQLQLPPSLKQPQQPQHLQQPLQPQQQQQQPHLRQTSYTQQHLQPQQEGEEEEQQLVTSSSSDRHVYPASQGQQSFQQPMQQEQHHQHQHQFPLCSETGGQPQQDTQARLRHAHDTISPFAMQRQQEEQQQQQQRVPQQSQVHPDNTQQLHHQQFPNQHQEEAPLCPREGTESERGKTAAWWSLRQQQQQQERQGWIKSVREQQQLLHMLHRQGQELSEQEEQARWNGEHQHQSARRVTSHSGEELQQRHQSTAQEQPTQSLCQQRMQQMSMQEQGSRQPEQLVPLQDIQQQRQTSIGGVSSRDGESPLQQQQQQQGHEHQKHGELKQNEINYLEQHATSGRIPALQQRRQSEREEQQELPFQAGQQRQFLRYQRGCLQQQHHVQMQQQHGHQCETRGVTNVASLPSTTSRSQEQSTTHVSRSCSALLHHPLTSEASGQQQQQPHSQQHKPQLLQQQYITGEGAPCSSAFPQQQQRIQQEQPPLTQQQQQFLHGQPMNLPHDQQASAHQQQHLQWQSYMPHRQQQHGVPQTQQPQHSPPQQPHPQQQQARILQEQPHFQQQTPPEQQPHSQQQPSSQQPYSQQQQCLPQEQPLPQMQPHLQLSHSLVPVGGSRVDFHNFPSGCNSWLSGTSSCNNRMLQEHSYQQQAHQPRQPHLQQLHQSQQQEASTRKGLEQQSLQESLRARESLPGSSELFFPQQTAAGPPAPSTLSSPVKAEMASHLPGGPPAAAVSASATTQQQQHHHSVCGRQQQQELPELHHLQQSILSQQPQRPSLPPQHSLVLQQQQMVQQPRILQQQQTTDQEMTGVRELMYGLYGVSSRQQQQQFPQAQQHHSIPHGSLAASSSFLSLFPPHRPLSQNHMSSGLSQQQHQQAVHATHMSPARPSSSSTSPQQHNLPLSAAQLPHQHPSPHRVFLLQDQQQQPAHASMLLLQRGTLHSLQPLQQAPYSFGQQPDRVSATSPALSSSGASPAAAAIAGGGYIQQCDFPSQPPRCSSNTSQMSLLLPPRPSPPTTPKQPQHRGQRMQQTIDPLLFSSATAVPSEASSLHTSCSRRSSVTAAESSSRRSSTHSAAGTSLAPPLTPSSSPCAAPVSVTGTPGSSGSGRRTRRETAAAAAAAAASAAASGAVLADNGSALAFPPHATTTASSSFYARHNTVAETPPEVDDCGAAAGFSATNTTTCSSLPSAAAIAAASCKGSICSNALNSSGNLRGPYAVFSARLAVPPPPELETACDRLAQLKAQPLIQQWLDSRDISWCFAFALVFNARIAAGSVNVNVRWAREPTVVGGAFLVGKGKTYSWRRAPQEASPHTIFQCFEAACKERQKTFGRSQHVDDYLVTLRGDLSTDPEGLQQAAESLMSLHAVDIFCGLTTQLKHAKDMLRFDAKNKSFCVIASSSSPSSNGGPSFFASFYLAAQRRPISPPLFPPGTPPPAAAIGSSLPAHASPSSLPSSRHLRSGNAVSFSHQHPAHIRVGSAAAAPHGGGGEVRGGADREGIAATPCTEPFASAASFSDLNAFCLFLSTPDETREGLFPAASSGTSNGSSSTKSDSASSAESSKSSDTPPAPASGGGACTSYGDTAAATSPHKRSGDDAAPAGACTPPFSSLKQVSYIFKCPETDCLSLLYTLNRVRLFCLHAKDHQTALIAQQQQQAAAEAAAATRQAAAAEAPGVTGEDEDDDEEATERSGFISSLPPAREMQHLQPSNNTPFLQQLAPPLPSSLPPASSFPSPQQQQFPHFHLHTQHIQHCPQQPHAHQQQLVHHQQHHMHRHQLQQTQQHCLVGGSPSPHGFEVGFRRPTTPALAGGKGSFGSSPGGRRSVAAIGRNEGLHLEDVQETRGGLAGESNDCRGLQREEGTRAQALSLSSEESDTPSSGRSSSSTRSQKRRRSSLIHSNGSSSSNKGSWYELEGCCVAGDSATSSLLLAAAMDQQESATTTTSACLDPLESVHTNAYNGSSVDHTPVVAAASSPRVHHAHLSSPSSSSSTAKGRATTCLHPADGVTARQSHAYPPFTIESHQHQQRHADSLMQGADVPVSQEEHQHQKLQQQQHCASHATENMTSAVQPPGFSRSGSVLASAVQAASPPSTATVTLSHDQPPQEILAAASDAIPRDILSCNVAEDSGTLVTAPREHRSGGPKPSYEDIEDEENNLGGIPPQLILPSNMSQQRKQRDPCAHQQEEMQHQQRPTHGGKMNAASQQSQQHPDAEKHHREGKEERDGAGIDQNGRQENQRDTHHIIQTAKNSTQGDQTIAPAVEDAGGADVTSADDAASAAAVTDAAAAAESGAAATAAKSIAGKPGAVETSTYYYNNEGLEQQCPGTALDSHSTADMSPAAAADTPSAALDTSPAAVDTFPCVSNPGAILEEQWKSTISSRGRRICASFGAKSPNNSHAAAPASGPPEGSEPKMVEQESMRSEAPLSVLQGCEARVRMKHEATFTAGDLACSSVSTSAADAASAHTSLCHPVEMYTAAASDPLGEYETATDEVLVEDVLTDRETLEQIGLTKMEMKFCETNEQQQREEGSKAQHEGADMFLRCIATATRRADGSSDPCFEEEKGVCSSKSSHSAGAALRLVAVAKSAGIVGRDGERATVDSEERATEALRGVQGTEEEEEYRKGCAARAAEDGCDAGDENACRGTRQNKVAREALPQQDHNLEESGSRSNSRSRCGRIRCLSVSNGEQEASRRRPKQSGGKETEETLSPVTGSNNNNENNGSRQKRKRTRRAVLSPTSSADTPAEEEGGREIGAVMGSFEDSCVSIKGALEELNRQQLSPYTRTSSSPRAAAAILETSHNMSSPTMQESVRSSLSFSSSCGSNISAPGDALATTSASDSFQSIVPPADETLDSATFSRAAAYYKGEAAALASNQMYFGEGSERGDEGERPNDAGVTAHVELESYVADGRVKNLSTARVVGRSQSNGENSCSVDSESAARATRGSRVRRVGGSTDASSSLCSAPRLEEEHPEQPICALEKGCHIACEETAANLTAKKLMRPAATAAAEHSRSWPRRGNAAAAAECLRGSNSNRRTAKLQQHEEKPQQDVEGKEDETGHEDGGVRWEREHKEKQAPSSAAVERPLEEEAAQQKPDIRDEVKGGQELQQRSHCAAKEEEEDDNEDEHSQGEGGNCRSSSKHHIPLLKGKQASGRQGCVTRSSAAAAAGFPTTAEAGSHERRNSSSVAFPLETASTATREPSGSTTLSRVQQSARAGGVSAARRCAVGDSSSSSHVISTSDEGHITRRGRRLPRPEEKAAADALFSAVAHAATNVSIRPAAPVVAARRSFQRCAGDGADVVPENTAGTHTRGAANGTAPAATSSESRVAGSTSPAADGKKAGKGRGAEESTKEEIRDEHCGYSSPSSSLLSSDKEGSWEAAAGGRIGKTKQIDDFHGQEIAAEAPAESSRETGVIVTASSPSSTGSSSRSRGSQRMKGERACLRTASARETNGCTTDTRCGHTCIAIEGANRVTSADDMACAGGCAAALGRGTLSSDAANEASAVVPGGTECSGGSNGSKASLSAQETFEQTNSDVSGAAFDSKTSCERLLRSRKLRQNFEPQPLEETLASCCSSRSRNAALAVGGAATEPPVDLMNRKKRKKLMRATEEDLPKPGREVTAAEAGTASVVSPALLTWQHHHHPNEDSRTVF